MRGTITGIVETAAIAIGLAVKKGTAANGIVIAGANEKALGVVIATDFNESVAVGEQASIAVAGVHPALAGGTFVLGDDLDSDADGNLIKAAGSATHNRVAQAMEAGADGQLVNVKVVVDEVIIA